MQTKSPTRKSAEPVKLGRSDWIQSAIETLKTQGIDAVQITRLSKQLNVSRGSFYWHFADRKTLLTAMLEYWKGTNSHAVDHALGNVETLSAAILAFFELWVKGTPFSADLEQAVRDWARLDKDVLTVVRDEDRMRIDSIAACYGKFGYANDEALIRARILYFAQIGYFAMHMQESMKDRIAMLELYYQSFTGQELDASVAAKHKHKFEGYA